MSEAIVVDAEQAHGLARELTRRRLRADAD